MLYVEDILLRFKRGEAIYGNMPYIYKELAFLLFFYKEGIE
ncbi:MAG: hypothetical protein U9Q40_06460 [Campylobacterota bacterium]|nr:hypothetical protein [Campylobacterota bacterium]